MGKEVTLEWVTRTISKAFGKEITLKGVTKACHLWPYQYHRNLEKEITSERLNKSWSLVILKKLNTFGKQYHYLMASKSWMFAVIQMPKHLGIEFTLD